MVTAGRWPRPAAGRDPVVVFPPDPRAARRARAADRAVIRVLGHHRAVTTATSAAAVVRRAAVMLAARDEHGYLHSPDQVCAALTDWHAAHRYPMLREAGRG